MKKDEKKKPKPPAQIYYENWINGQTFWAFVRGLKRKRRGGK